MEPAANATELITVFIGQSLYHLNYLVDGAECAALGGGEPLVHLAAKLADPGLDNRMNLVPNDLFDLVLYGLLNYPLNHLFNFLPHDASNCL